MSQLTLYNAPGPEATLENSPAFQGWVKTRCGPCPAGTAGNLAARGNALESRPKHLQRPARDAGIGA